jgi:hypothetical protein
MLVTFNDPRGFVASYPSDLGTTIHSCLDTTPTLTFGRSSESAFTNI